MNDDEKEVLKRVANHVDLVDLKSKGFKTIYCNGIPLGVKCLSYASREMIAAALGIPGNYQLFQMTMDGDIPVVSGYMKLETGMTFYGIPPTTGG